MDPGLSKSKQMKMFGESGFKNGDISLTEQQILGNIQDASGLMSSFDITRSFLYSV